MSNEKLMRLAHIIIVILGSCVLLFVFLKYIFPIALPFAIGWAIAFAVRPLGRAAEKKFGIPKRVIMPIVAVLLLLLLVGAVVGLGVTIGIEGWDLLSELAASGELDSLLSKLVNPFEGRFSGAYSKELEEYLGSTVESLVTNLLGGFAGLIGGIVSAIPKILLFMLVTLISTVYFCADLDRINGFVMKKLPPKIAGYIRSFKENSLSVVMKYARSYLIIMLITFFLMLIGFSILNVKYALLISAVVAVLDALPLFGVGTVLVPYSVVAFASGDTRLGVGLLLLFVVNEIIRQIIEPKILGKNLGIHPLITVILLYAGYTLLGFAGLLILPLFAVAVNCFVKKTKSAEVKK